jgi:hypothetical protein
MKNDQEKHSPEKENKHLLKSFEVTAQGSLGILALGHVGILAWKKKREEEELNKKTDHNE